jgi:putative MFS transporter
MDGPSSEHVSLENEDRSYRPRWLWVTPYLGKAPALTRRQWRVLGLIAFVTMFDQYDLVLFSLALKQIQTDLGIPEAQLGQLGALVRLGALPALILTALADQLGRRRVLVWTIAGYTLLTGATAFAPNVASFVALQFLARAFAVTEVALAYVVVAEELDPEHRGWGMGALAALATMGNALALIAFGSVGASPGGWRTLYLLGLPPLLALAWLRRSLPETRRFEAHATTRAAAHRLRHVLEPLVKLARMYPGRLLAICAVVFLLSVSDYSSLFFGTKYFQEVHGWSPKQFATMGVLGGFFGIFGAAFAGRLSDARGRRRVALVFLALQPLFVIGYYNASGPALVPLWIGATFLGFGGRIVIAAFGQELFPTSHRAVASGAREAVGTLGGVVGLALESRLYGALGTHWSAVSALAAVALLSPVIVAAFFPETSGRTLEETAPERAL